MTGRALAIVLLAAAPGTAQAAGWELGPSIDFYFPRQETGYWQPTLTVDHAQLHLEGRYQYEALDTGSLLAGANFSVGGNLKLRFTPMIGAAFGKYDAVLLGLTTSIEWSVLSLLLQGQYAFALDQPDSSFFYSWDELGVTVHWLEFGAALQRTRVFHTATEFQAGPFIQVSVWKLAFSAYLFAPGQDDQSVVLGVSASL